MVLDFSRPELLVLLLLVPAWGLRVRLRDGGGVLFSLAGSLTHPKASAAGARLLAAGPDVLRGVVLASFVLALAGPHRVVTVPVLADGGRGIGLVLDLSTSMLADDLEGAPSRLEMAREAAVRFAQRRAADELSLVAFGGEAITRVPPTNDANVIASGVRSLRADFVRNGTDIAGAVLTSVAQLLTSDVEPRVVVLLTDGAHNQAGVQPYATARAAAALGVRVHSISITSSADAGGSDFAGLGPEGDEAAVETVLSGVAALTGGQYFRATSAAALDSIYREIDRIESPFAIAGEREEREPLHAWLLGLGLLALAAEVALRGSRWGVLR